MSERDETIHPEAVEPAPVESAAAGDEPMPAVRQRRSGAALAVLMAVAALALAAWSVWRVTLIERGEDYAHAESRQRLDALDARLAEAERRSARSNELASTLREQLAENERLHVRLREDLLAQAERSARMESLLARLSRERGSAAEQLALNDAGLLLGQAQVRLDLFGDRAGAMVALTLAEQSLAQAGGSHADVRAAVADARAALAADARPASSALLAELDAVAAVIDAAPLRVDRSTRTGAAEAGVGGWWQRQFERFDRLVTIRRVDEVDPLAAPTKDAAHRALDRARLAVVEQGHGLLPELLTSVRTSLLACCDAEAVADAAARLQRLAGLNWNAPTPDLGALRERLDHRVQIEQLSLPESEPMSEPPIEASDDPQAQEDAA